jgi:hypothetical protein
MGIAPLRMSRQGSGKLHMRSSSRKRDGSAGILPAVAQAACFRNAKRTLEHGRAMTVDSNPSDPQDDQLLAREKLLAQRLKGVASELRLVDLVDLIAYIRNEQFANIEDLVNSSSELYFKQGTLTFGWAADLALDWNVPPKVKLDMEFRHLAVSVFFCLMLEPRQASVDIRCVIFERPSADPVENTKRLAEALADASLLASASNV